ncbi:hypothetical protein Pcinc_029149 [Petrolisthes cinctipes]|uniref:Ionotropic glutamate receptor L-glutamate and glycine-binding domain-containing protein n=1 Tax=Petrolisthes cinctipes TaxID=88211 RepID=A0AAE1F1K9_PETCI|nr:hypothetical protein Pcinc_029149 [Petrolisthes cinctipes]
MMVISVGCDGTYSDPLQTPTSEHPDVVLGHLLGKTLAGRHLLLALDPGASLVLDLKALLGGRGEAVISSSSGSSVSLLDAHHPDPFLQRARAEFLRGGHYVAVLAFTSSPDLLLDSLTERWNPDYLVLLSLNSAVNTTRLLMDERIQRSRHIALLETDSAVLEQDTTLLEKSGMLLDQDGSLLEKSGTLLDQDKALLEEDMTLLEKNRLSLKKAGMLLEPNTVLPKYVKTSLKQNLKSTRFNKSFQKGRYRVFTSQPFTPHGRGWGVKLPLGAWREGSNFSDFSALFPERFPTLGGQTLYLGSWCDDFPFLYPGGGGDGDGDRGHGDGDDGDGGGDGDGVHGDGDDGDDGDGGHGDGGVGDGGVGVADGDEGSCIGCGLDLLDMLAGPLNFTYHVQMEPKDHNWGSKNEEDGRWTGMLGDLVYHNKHLVINTFQVIEALVAEFDICYPYHMEDYEFLLSVPPPAPQWKGLLYPLKAEMWGAVLAMTCLVVLLLTICLTLFPDTQDPSTVFLLVVGAEVRQSVPERLGRWWGRVWVGWWWLGCVIITTAYTCNLVAFLTVPVFPRRIETVQELAASGLRVCMQDYGSFVPDALKDSPHDLDLQHLGQNFDLFPYVYLRYDVGLSWLADYTHALIETHSYLAYIVRLHHVSHSTYVMKETVYPGYMSWVLKKNTPYTSRLSVALAHLVESGLVHYLYLKHMDSSSSPNTGAATQTSKVSAGGALQMGQMLGAFMVWGLGVGVASLALAVEFLLLPRLHHHPQQSP